MKKTKKNFTTLAQFQNKYFGKRGTAKREKFESDYEMFKIGVLLREARLAKCLTQEELAAKIGKNKSYISKIENDVKEARLSTLQRLVELGLGGRVKVSISL